MLPELTAGFCKAVQAVSAGALPITRAAGTGPLATSSPPRHPNLSLERETENWVGHFKEGEKDLSAPIQDISRASPVSSQWMFWMLRSWFPSAAPDCWHPTLAAQASLHGPLILALTNLFASSKDYPRQEEPGQRHEHIRVSL